MVVIPDQPCALIVGVVVLGLVGSRALVQDRVIQKTRTLHAVGVHQSNGPPSLDPRHQPAVEVGRRSVLRQFSAWDRLCRRARYGSAGSVFLKVICTGCPLVATITPPRCAGVGFPAGLNPHSVVGIAQCLDEADL